MQPLEEVTKNIFSFNFAKAFQVAEAYLESFDLETIQREPGEYIRAKEMYLVSRFFFVRYDRVQSRKNGVEKARMFRGFFPELEEFLQKEIPAEHSRNSEIMKDIRTFMHSQIAEGFAQEFAGQRSYNLDHKEVLQLVQSLLFLKNYKSAGDVLYFLYQLNARDPEVNIVLGLISGELGDQDSFRRFLSEGLFIQPRILEKYQDLIPPGVYRDLWEDLDGEDAALRGRKYAIVLEINGMLQSSRRLVASENKRLESEYVSLKKEYQNKPSEEFKLKIIHILIWILRFHHASGNFDQLNFYRAELMDFDMELWRVFQEKNLQDKNPGGVY